MKRTNHPVGKAVDKRLYIIGMTRKELAEKAGVGYIYLNGALGGRHRLPIGVSDKIADIIGMDACELRALYFKAS